MHPTVIQGKNHADHRGEVAFVNDFNFDEIKRFYTITNANTSQFRAWQGHKLDNKNFYCVSGSFDIYFVKIDNWDNPSKDLKIEKITLSAKESKVLFIPAGYANGIKSLELNSKLLSLSTLPLGDVKDDDVRFDSNYWEIEENEVENSKIHLSIADFGGNEMSFIQEAFNSNWITTIGNNVNEFEKLLEGYLGDSKHVVAVNSGTSALHLALILLGITQGDVVVCQSFTFSASANPIIYQGATPIFVDSEIDTWNLCPMHLENAIINSLKLGKKPKAIIAVHLFGMPFKVDEIVAISKKYNIPIIEDSAEALGGAYKRKKCGTFGDISVFSFNGNKIITTSAGGAIVLDSSELKQKAIFYATQARDNKPYYQHSKIGYNYRMSNICAGIGRGQMQVLQKHIEQKRANHSFYCKVFAHIEGVFVLTEPSEEYFSNFWLSTILVNPLLTAGKTAENLRLFLESKNIESRPLWKPLHLQPIFKQYPFFGSDVSAHLFENGLCLPSSCSLSNIQKERISYLLADFFA